MLIARTGGPGRPTTAQAVVDIAKDYIKRGLLVEPKRGKGWKIPLAKAACDIYLENGGSGPYIKPKSLTETDSFKRWVSGLEAAASAAEKSAEN